MEYKIHFHNHSEAVINNDVKFIDTFKELTSVIKGIKDDEIIEKFIITRDTGKESKKSPSTAINNILKEKLVNLGWKSESPIFAGNDYQYEIRKGKYTKRKLGTWRLDFVKNLIAVEVAFNHGEAIAHNLLKPHLSSQMNHVNKETDTQLGIVICVTEKFKKRCNFDSAVGHYEKQLVYLKPYSQILSTPLVIIGLDGPLSFKINEKKEVVYQNLESSSNLFNNTTD